MEDGDTLMAGKKMEYGKGTGMCHVFDRLPTFLAGIGRMTCKTSPPFCPRADACLFFERYYNGNLSVFERVAHLVVCERVTVVSPFMMAGGVVFVLRALSYAQVRGGSDVMRLLEQV